MIDPGKYSAKITDYGYHNKPGKSPSVMVTFAILETGDSITWFGSFNGGAKPITIDTLVNKLGYKGSDGVDIAQGGGSNVLDENKHFELVIYHDTYTGEPQPRIKYINIPGERGTMANRVDADAAKVIVGGLNLKGDFLSIRKNEPKVQPVEKDDDVNF